MKAIGILRRGAVATAFLGVLFPQVLLVAAPRSQPSGTIAGWTGTAVADIALLHDGTVWGKIVDRQGSALRGVPVFLRYRGQGIARSITDDGGWFKFEGLDGGVYHVATPFASQVLRLWTAGAAPPGSKDHAILIGGPAIRGQYEYVEPDPASPNDDDRNMLTFLANPWIVATLLATAIAIPMFVDADEDDPPAS